MADFRSAQLHLSTAMVVLYSISTATDIQYTELQQMTAFSLVKNGRVVNTFELRTIHLNTFPSVLYIRTDCPRTIFFEILQNCSNFQYNRHGLRNIS